MFIILYKMRQSFELSYLQTYDSFAFQTIQNQESPFSFDIAKVTELDEKSSSLYDLVKSSLKFEPTLKGNSISQV